MSYNYSVTVSVPVCHSAVYTGDLKVLVFSLTAVDTASQPHTTCIFSSFSMLQSKMTVTNGGHVPGLGSQVKPRP
jgi:hypothetical protein